MATVKLCWQLLLVVTLLQLLVNHQIESKAEYQQKEINILLLLSFEIREPTTEQPWFVDGPMNLPAAELVVEQINQREDVLGGFLIVANSACNLQGHTAVNFVTSLFHSGIKFAGIVGPVCSDSEDFVSCVTRKDSVSILNFHTATSPRFTDRSIYRYSFGTVHSSYSTVSLALNLMKENYWESVAVLYEESKFVFLTAYNLLVQDLPRAFPQGNVTFAAPVSGVSFPLVTIIDKHIRVIIVLSTWTVAQKMM